jgi:hypothetical protein
LIELEEGKYTFTASAEGYKDSTETVEVVAGRTISLAIKLTVDPAARALPSMAEWLGRSGWARVNEWYVGRGGGYVLYPVTPLSGSVAFTVFRRNRLFGGERIRWVVGYHSSEDHILFEADQKKLYRTVVIKGKRGNQREIALPGPGGGGDVLHTFQLDVSPAKVVVRLRTGDSWSEVDACSLPDRDISAGRFGFYVPGDDEIRVSNFTFTPR